MRMDIKTLYNGQFTKTGVFERVEEFLNPKASLHEDGLVFEPLRIRKSPDPSKTP